MSTRSYALIVNPSSGAGRGSSLLPEAEGALNERGLEFRTVVTTSLEHGVKSATQAHANGEVPVVMSGDGMVGQIGGALAGTGATMGLIPGGRGNDLARVLGIPSGTGEAADVIAAGDVQQVDVGEVNERRFLCIASMGFDSEANRIANDAKLVRGNLVYAYAALRALAAWKPATFTLRFDGAGEHTFTGYAVAAANSKAFGGGMFIAPDADLEDGRFDVVMTGKVGKLRFLANLPKVFKGTHIEEDEIEVRRAATVRVSADRPFRVYADGEHLTDLPAELRILPKALGILAPAAPAP